MIILTQQELRASRNEYIQDLVDREFVVSAGKNNTRDTLIMDGHRNLLINNKPIPAAYLSMDKIDEYIIKQFGEKRGNELLECYSQVPTYPIAKAILHPCLINEHYEEFLLSNEGTDKSINIYVNGQDLCYEIKLNEIVFINGLPFPGVASCLSRYDESKQNFVVCELQCSNTIIAHLIMGNLFDNELLFTEIHHRTTQRFIPNLLDARQILLEQTPSNDSDDNPSWAVTLAKEFADIEYQLSHAEQKKVLCLLESYQMVCQNKINTIGQQVDFTAERLLLNKIAQQLEITRPFNGQELLAKAEEEAKKFIPKLFEARKMLVDQTPINYSDSNPPWTVTLQQELAYMQNRLNHAKESDLLDFLEQYRENCQKALDTAAPKIHFVPGQLLLNKVAVQLDMKMPFSKKEAIANFFNRSFNKFNPF